MGRSTDAILFYGVTWPKEGWPSLVNLGPGKFDPPVDETDPPIYSDDEEDVNEPHSGAEKEYLRRKGLWQPEQGYARFKELEPTIPFEVVRHCSSDAPMYALAVRGTVTRACRGYPKQIKIHDMLPYSPTQESKHAAALREVCAVLKLQQPNPYSIGWYLVSDLS